MHDAEKCHLGVQSCCRFLGCRILQLQHGFALVEYASLYEDEEGTQALKEWFPVPGPGPAADPDAGAAAAGGYYFHTDLSNMLRPQPPQEVSSKRTCIVSHPDVSQDALIMWRDSFALYLVASGLHQRSS